MGTPIPNSRIEQAAAEVNNDVTIYTLTPEEIAARYGPPNPRKEDNPFYARLVQAVKVSDSLEEAAGLLKTSVGQLNQYLRRRNIFPDWKIKTEEETETVEIAAEIQKTEKKKTRLQIAREKLTREQYLAMKKQGLSDVYILKKAGIKGFDVLSILKNQWGVQGLGLRKQPTVTLEEYQEAKRAAEAVGVFLLDLGTAIERAALYDEIQAACNKAPEREAERDRELSPYADNDDDVEWAVPLKPLDKKPILTVREKHVSINSRALKELAGVKHVMVGVSRQGNIVIRKGEGPECYAVTCNEIQAAKGASAKIGGGVLIKFLAQHGIKPGKYPLVRNEARDRWEAEVASQ